VYLLKTRKVSAAVPAISKLVADASAPPFVRLEACDALADLAPKAGSWKPACADLLTSGDDTMIRVRAAGVLARTGDARGWPLVSENPARPARRDRTRLLCSRATRAESRAGGCAPSGISRSAWTDADQSWVGRSTRSTDHLVPPSTRVSRGESACSRCPLTARSRSSRPSCSCAVRPDARDSQTEQTDSRQPR